jgi:hypothetical protein
MAQNIDMLRGAALANGVSIEGRTYHELRLALGGVLVDKMLGSSPPPSTSPPPANGKRPCDESSQEQPKVKKTRKPTNWHVFLKAEKHKIHEGMPDLKGTALIAEAARRWKLHKQALAGASPLMIMDGSSGADSDSASDGAVEGLTVELLEHASPAEINANLEIAGIQVDADPQINASRLASQMIEL